jgi:sec-independent protein translocase protein TatC
MAEQDADNSGLAEGRMTLIGHLTELRNRLGVALGVFLLLFLISVAPLPGTTSNSIAYQVFVFLQAPLAEILNAKGGGRMIFTALHEGFFTQIKVGFLTVFDCHTGSVHPWCGDGLLCCHANGMGVLRVI